MHALLATDHDPVKFIRFDNRKQRWYILDEGAVKQKIGQSIREIMYRHHPKPLVVKKANVLTIKNVAKELVQQFRGNANNTFDFTESAPVLEEVSGHQKNGLVSRHGNAGEVVRSDIFSLDNILVRYESNALESSREWFTIGGLSNEDSDVVDIIDNVF